MKILILNQSNIDITKDIEKARSFFAPYINFDYEVKTVSNIPTNLVVGKITDGFDKNTGQPTKVSYMSLDSQTRCAIQNLQLTGYDQVIFAYNLDNFNLGSNEVATSWTESNPIFTNCIFIQLSINQYAQDKDNLWKTLAHEQVHALCYASNQFFRIPVVDEMDNTNVNGQLIPFYNNDQPTNPDSNFGHTLKNLKPFFEGIKNPNNTVRTLKLTSPMMRGEDVKELQLLLGTLTPDGIFGKQTQAMVKVFQARNGLVIDGIVGKKTWEALKSKKKLSPSEKCIAIIKDFEGFSPKPYKDIGGLVTIGYGSCSDVYGKPVTMKHKYITKSEAEVLLRRDVTDFAYLVDKELQGVDLNQNQYDAIISLVYNIGISNFRKSNLLKNLRNGKEVVKDNFISWNKVGKKVVQGLINRRQKEWQLFSYPQF